MNLNASAPATTTPLRAAFLTRHTPLMALVVLYILWGTTYLAMRIAVESLPPFLMAGTRFVVAGLALLAILRALGAAPPSRREWILAIPLGFLFFVLGNGVVAIAEKTLDSSVAAVVAATAPLLAAGIGLATGDRPKRSELLGAVLGLSGVVLLSVGALAKAGASGLVILIAPMAWSLGSVLARRKGATGFSSAASQMLVGGMWMLLLSPFLGESVPHSVGLRPLLAWGYLVVLGSVVGFSAFVYLLRTTRPAVAMSYAYVNPIVAVLVGALLGGEHVGWPVVMATCLIATGVMIAVKARQPS